MFRELCGLGGYGLLGVQSRDSRLDIELRDRHRSNLRLPLRLCHRCGSLVDRLRSRCRELRGPLRLRNRDLLGRRLVVLHLTNPLRLRNRLLNLR